MLKIYMCQAVRLGYLNHMYASSIDSDESMHPCSLRRHAVQNTAWNKVKVQTKLNL